MKTEAQIAREWLRTEHRRAANHLDKMVLRLKSSGLEYHTIYSRNKYWREKLDLLKVFGTDDEVLKAKNMLKKTEEDMDWIKAIRKEIKKAKKLKKEAWDRFTSIDVNYFNEKN
jgi:hypothetical protein